MTHHDRILTIAIATMGDRILRLIDFNFDPLVSWIIVWQQPSDDIDLSWIDQTKINLIKKSNSGVASSRNMAIELCKTKWLWFADDDIAYKEGVLCEVIKRLRLLREKPVQIIITSVADSVGLIWKTPTEFNRYFVYPSISGVGTIQIIIDAEFAQHKGVLFPVDMGLGTKFPACDEPVFLWSLISVGAKPICWKDICVIHPVGSSGDNWFSAGAAESRGQMLRRLYGLGWRGAFMLNLFLVKNFFSGLKYKNSLKAMQRVFSGYFNY